MKPLKGRINHQIFIKKVVYSQVAKDLEGQMMRLNLVDSQRTLYKSALMDMKERNFGPIKRMLAIPEIDRDNAERLYVSTWIRNMDTLDEYMPEFFDIRLN